LPKPPPTASEKTVQRGTPLPKQSSKSRAEPEQSAAMTEASTKKPGQVAGLFATKTTKKDG
jgi:hypothetical protein